MATAFWLFATNAGDGSEDNANRPALPVTVGGKWTSPGDIVRLTGPAGPNAHVHLLVGGVALPDDNLAGLAGEGHRHYVVNINGNWAQVTVGTTNHTHTLNIGASGQPVPDYFMLFWAGSDAHAATIAGDANCFPIVEAAMTQDGDGNWNIGDLDGTVWTGGLQTTWETRCLNILGVQLPSQVDRGERLVRLFLGALLSRQTGDDKGYRYTS